MLLARPRIVVVDDYYEKPDEVRSRALSAELAEHPDYHKGRRSQDEPIPEGTQQDLAELLGRKFVNGYRCFQLCVAGDQVVYHSDHQSHAAIVSLSPNAPVEAGTSFLRSRTTGLRAGPTQSDADRIGRPLDELLHDTYEDKLLDRTAWDEVDRIGNVYNRLVVWDARMIHAASCYFGTKPEDGRLFEMFFFEME